MWGIMNTKNKTWADIQAEAKAVVDAKHAQEQALKDAVPKKENFIQKAWRVLRAPPVYPVWTPEEEKEEEDLINSGFHPCYGFGGYITGDDDDD